MQLVEHVQHAPAILGFGEWKHQHCAHAVTGPRVEERRQQTLVVEVYQQQPVMV